MSEATRTPQPVPSPGAPRPADGPEAGFALVLVLWLLVVLSLQVAAMQASVRDGIRLGETATSVIRGEALMQATLEQAVAHLLATEPRARWMPDGTERVLRLGDAEVAVTMTDEAGRVNINLADQTLLEGLVLAATRSQRDARAIAQRIVATRSGEDTGRREAGTPQEQRLRGPGPATPVAPKSPFLDVADLVRLPEVDEAMLERLAPHVTTATGSGAINPMVASETVLRALPGVTPDAIARVLALQQLGGDQSAAIASLLGAARQYLVLRPAQPQEAPEEEPARPQPGQRPRPGQAQSEQPQGGAAQGGAAQLARGTALRVHLAVRADPHHAIGSAETIIVIGLNSAAPYSTVAWRHRVARP
jgi:general secretion pathway protein K